MSHAETPKDARILSPVPVVDPDLLAQRRAEVKEEVEPYVDPDDSDHDLDYLQTVIDETIEDIATSAATYNPLFSGRAGYRNTDYHCSEYTCVETACAEGGYEAARDGRFDDYLKIEVRTATSRAYRHATEDLDLEIAQELGICTAHERLALKAKRQAERAAAAAARDAEIARREAEDKENEIARAERLHTATPAPKSPTFDFSSHPHLEDTAEHREGNILYRARLEPCESTPWDAWEAASPRSQARHIEFIKDALAGEIWAYGMVMEAYQIDDEGKQGDHPIAEASLWSLWPDVNGGFDGVLDEVAADLFSQVSSEIAATRAKAA